MNPIMKLLPALLGMSILFAACQSNNEENWPEDLAGKEQLLQEKRQAQASINKDIARLEEEISRLDPDKRAHNARLVTTEPVARKDFQHFVQIQGDVQSSKVVSVTTEVPGRLLKVTVEEGDRVKQGQVIATVDMDQVAKQIQEVETALNLAETTYERQKKLWEQNIGSELQYLETKNNKERLETQLERLKLQVSKGEVRAPITGVVETKNLREGEFASPGVPIVRLLDENNIKVSVDVPETYIRAARRGKKVTVEFPALGIKQEAFISLVGSSINSANRTFKVEAKVRNEKGLLKPNLLAVLYLQDKAIDQAVVIPLELVQQEVSGKDYVFVAREGEDGMTAHKVYVTTGDSYGGEVVIVEGLQGGEQLIVLGAKGLGDEQDIRVKAEKTEANNG